MPPTPPQTSTSRDTAAPTLRLVNTARRASETSAARPRVIPPSPPRREGRGEGRTSLDVPHQTPSSPSRPSRSTLHNPSPAATRESANLCASDPRWVLAVRTASYLDAGRAGLLAPDKRDRLITTAKHLGIRPFDAHLVIAIVQDAARMGLPPLSPDTAERLALLDLPQSKRGHKPALPRNASALQTLLGITITTTFLLAAALLWLHR